MKPQIILALVLVIAGVVSFFFEDVFLTRKEKVVDVGPVEITADKKERIPVGPIVGGVCVAAGLGLLYLGRKTG